MTTVAEIRNKAARRLGVLGVGQTLQNNIQADLDEAYEEVYSFLQTKSLTLRS